MSLGFATGEKMMPYSSRELQRLYLESWWEGGGENLLPFGLGNFKFEEFLRYPSAHVGYVHSDLGWV